MPAAEVPAARISLANDQAVRGDGDYVLYWMIANRRTRYNFAMQRAAWWCSELGKPLVVLEALRCGYRWASDRLHRFVLQGMADNRDRVADGPALYYPYVEPKQGDGSGLLEELAKSACVVVTDDFPCFFLPRMVGVAAKKLPVQVETVDANGLFPMRSTDRVFARAFDFRRFLQKELPDHLADMPKVNPLSHLDLPTIKSLPEAITNRWPMADETSLAASVETLANLPINHEVTPACFDGGMQAAGKALKRFLNQRLNRYADERNQPDAEAASGFSPYLHFGHLSAHEVFDNLAQQEDWNSGRLADKTNGAKEGWWGMSDSAESFFDELITWRELGYNMCAHRDDYDQYESLPAWAVKSLKKHENDRREHVYSLEEFERAQTHDPLWNAAQRQLVREGRMHNYLRMLWGKKVLHWTARPRDAVDILIELNNKYAVDGRNPNSYSGIFWCLGRYDRAWGPERPIFGKIRYMTSESTARKLRVKGYLERYGPSDDKQQSLPGF